MTEAETTSDAQVTFKVKTSGDKTHTITMAESASVSDLKTKLAGSDFEDIPIERQRLIYSGRVMKNEEPLSTYKIKAGNTVHLVKSAASNPTPAPSSTSSSTPAVPQVPTNMAAGTANNPLAGLTGARYAGLTNLPSADMFGPDGGMSGAGMSEEDLENMLSNPNVQQQMNEMMNNDAFIQMMESHPAFRNNPQALAMLRSPELRRMMLNPETLRSAARMQRMMRGGGGQGGASAFPMPGVTDTTPGANPSATGAGNDSGNAGGQANPFDPQAAWANLGLPGGAGGAGAGAGAGGANPFGAFFNPFAAAGQQGQGAGTTQGAAGTEGNAAAQGDAQANQGNNGAPQNPFASLFGGLGAGGLGAGGPGAGGNPFAGMPPPSQEAMQQMMQMLGMGSPGGGSPAPPDNRPPEERYAEQLRQLNDMGFYDFDRNVAALRRSGGSVQGAIEHLLSS